MITIIAHRTPSGSVTSAWNSGPAFAVLRQMDRCHLQQQPTIGGAYTFHAEESAEVIGMSELWRVNKKGERERMW